MIDESNTGEFWFINEKSCLPREAVFLFQSTRQFQAFVL